MRLTNGFRDTIDGHSYPATTEEVIAEHGNLRLELPNGDERLADVLNRLSSETFENAEELRLSTYSAVSSKAIGRENYSDRDPVCPGEDGPQQVSF